MPFDSLANYAKGIYRGFFPRKFREQVYDINRDVDKIEERVRGHSPGQDLSVLLTQPPSVLENAQLTMRLGKALGRPVYVVISDGCKSPCRASISVINFN